MSRLLTALAVVILALAAQTTARAVDPVNAAVTVDRTSINVGDRIALAIVVDAEPGYLPSDPTIARQIGSFEVVQTHQAQKVTRGSQIQFIYKYSITAWSVGSFVLPPIAITWIGPNGETGTARTGEVPISVVTVIAQGESTADIKPLKPQLTVSEELLPTLTRIAFALAGVAVLTALGALLLWLLIRRRDAGLFEERLTPVQRALRELDQLAELKLPEQGKTAEHYARLTASLRQYAVARFGVQPGRTSREVRDALERAGLERTQAAAIYEILREGDEVRFRHSTPYPAHAQNAVRAALEVIRRAASAEEYETAALQTQ
jgi:hypothetical protein